MFEYDPDKSAASLVKHGIDFEQAQELWDDVVRAEIKSGANTEERWLLIGQIGDRNWTAVYTVRRGNIRIISVRRSRENEVSEYVSRQDN